MSRVLIIADDVTGANDTGVQFAKRDIQTVSWLSGPCPEADVLVVNAETRSLSKEQAVSAIYSFLDQVSLQPYSVVYKKIDSTLRGHVGAEIDALLASGVFDGAVFVPAYPDNGRITVGGFHIVGGKLVGDTEIARDPRSPVQESHIPSLLVAQSTSAVQHISIHDVRNDLVLSRLAKVNDPKTIVVCDAATPTDVGKISESIIRSGRSFLWVGSAGLAGALAKQTASSTAASSQRTAAAATKQNGQPFVVAGSMSAVTKAQIQHMSKQKGIGIIAAHPAQLAAEQTQEQEISRCIQAVIEAVEAGVQPVLTLQEEKSHLPLNASSQIAASLGVIAAQVVKSAPVAGLVLTGGDIAAQTLQQLEVEQLTIIGEVEEGIPFCELNSGPFTGLPVITKAGAFGQPGSQLAAVHKIKEWLADRLLMKRRKRDSNENK